MLDCMYKNWDFSPMPLCSLITAWGPNLIMSGKDRYNDIKDVWLCYNGGGGGVLYSPSSMEFMWTVG